MSGTCRYAKASLRPCVKWIINCTYTSFESYTNTDNCAWRALRVNNDAESGVLVARINFHVTRYEMIPINSE